MGERRKLKERLESHRRALQRHVKKIKEEQSRPRSRQYLIELWEKQIENIRRQIEKIERRLKP